MRPILAGLISLLCSVACGQCIDRNGDGRCDWTPVRNIAQASIVILDAALPPYEFTPTLAPVIESAPKDSPRPVRSILLRVREAKPVRRILSLPVRIVRRLCES